MSLLQLPATYPMSPPEIRLPELDGKTPKMYRGGKICCDVHFNPLWGKHAPSYGIAHAMALGVDLVRARKSLVGSVAGCGDPPLGRIRFAVVCLMQTSHQVTVPSHPCPSSSSCPRNTSEVPPSFARRPHRRACGDCRLWQTTSAWDTRRSGNDPTSRSSSSPYSKGRILSHIQLREHDITRGLLHHLFLPMTLLSRSYEDGCEGLAVGAVRDEELNKHVVVAQNVVKVVGVQRDHLVIPVDPNELVSDVASRHQLRVLLSFLLDLLHLLLDRLQLLRQRLLTVTHDLRIIAPSSQTSFISL